MPKRGARWKFKATFRRFKTKKTCKPKNQVPDAEAESSAGGRLRRIAKEFQLKARRKIRRDLNCMSPLRGVSQSQRQRNRSSVTARSQPKQICTDRRSLRSEPVAELPVLLRCARTPKYEERRRTSLLDLPQDIRDKIFDRIIDMEDFKVPASSNHAALSFATHASLVSYVKGIPPVSHQFYDDFIAAVCRHPSCCMIITIQDMSRAQYYRRKQQIHPLIPPFAIPEFYPGQAVKAEVVIPRAPKAYDRHIRDLRLHCVIDRSDLGTDKAKSIQPGMTDTAPSIQEILAIRDRLPSLQHCDINVYFTMREIMGANYSLLWIDDCLKPLAVLPTESTVIQAMIPVIDSQDPKDPTCQPMRPWRACPGGPDEADWLHHGHARGVKDLSGIWNCYRCLRDNQLLHRYKRMERGWIPHREGTAYFQTSASRWRDQATGNMVTNVLHHVVNPTQPIPPPQPHNDPRLTQLVNLFASYGDLPGGNYVYRDRRRSSQYTIPASGWSP